ncbi:hypothetical protein BHE74_00004472 [Ensete ventricosum]|nr:hypothetical protein BHE74_00004472 [Ensete ventricosum]
MPQTRHSDPRSNCSSRTLIVARSPRGPSGSSGQEGRQSHRQTSNRRGYASEEEGQCFLEPTQVLARGRGLQVPRIQELGAGLPCPPDDRPPLVQSQRPTSDPMVHTEARDPDLAGWGRLGGVYKGSVDPLTSGRPLLVTVRGADRSGGEEHSVGKYLLGFISSYSILTL